MDNEKIIFISLTALFILIFTTNYLKVKKDWFKIMECSLANVKILDVKQFCSRGVSLTLYNTGNFPVKNLLIKVYDDEGNNEEAELLTKSLAPKTTAKITKICLR